MRRPVGSLILAGILFAFGAGQSAFAETTVVTSIKPVHSLVAGVMEGVGAPYLIVKGASSPHTYSLKPSDAKALEQANAVFWVGDGVETFLGSSIDKLARSALIVELAKAPGLTLHEIREGGPWAAHEDHDDHGEHADGEHTEAEGHHDHDGVDMHLWLDPDNAKAMVAKVVKALAKADPENAAAYRANGRTLTARLDALTAELEGSLSPVRSKPFVVFHDGFQYFEKRFGLNAAGSVTVSPEIQPGADRLRQIRHRISELGAVCVFAEPQFASRLIDVVIEGTKASAGVLDPLGADLNDGPELYFTLMKRNAATLKDCLALSG